MFQNVVIGIDGGAGGRSAIALARRLVAPGAELTLAHVYGLRVIAGRGAGVALVLEAEASERLLEHERVNAGLGDVEMLRSSETSVGRGLHEIAHHVKADLIVIGSTHRHGAGRFMLGDDTAAVMHGSPCPVAVARLEPEFQSSLARIGVGWDGSAESPLALAAGKALAVQLAAELRVLSVVTVEVSPYWEPISGTLPAVQETQQYLAGVPALKGLDVQVVHGDPARQLELWSHDLDLLIVGSRSQGLLGRTISGSVATHLTLRCACPLLVWPRSAGETAGTVEPGQVISTQP